MNLVLESRSKKPQFILNFGGVLHRLRNFFAKQFSKPAPHSFDVLLNRIHAHPHPLRYQMIRIFIPFPRNIDV